MGIEIGKCQTLKVVKEVDFGVYLGFSQEEKVLLPKRQVPAGTEIGSEIEVFTYKDSDDRLICTTKQPALEIGGLAVLRVKEVAGIGAFLDWGLEKDLLLPFREQTAKVQEGEECLVTLYVDKSDRLCATMKVYHCLEVGSPYKKNDVVQGRIYEISNNYGAFVAVDDKYSALIPKQQMFGDNIKVGAVVEARITDVKPDGKLNLTVRLNNFTQTEENMKKIMSMLESSRGFLPLHDKSDPEEIRRMTGMSKSDFKKAIGHLYKERRIELLDNGIKISFLRGEE